MTVSQSVATALFVGIVPRLVWSFVNILENKSWLWIGDIHAAGNNAAPAKKRSLKSVNHQDPNGMICSDLCLTSRWVATLEARSRRKDEFAVAA